MKLSNRLHKHLSCVAFFVDTATLQFLILHH
jgi:hypothetical protein